MSEKEMPPGWGVQEALPTYDEVYAAGGELALRVVTSTPEPGGPWFEVPSSIIVDPRLHPLTKLYAIALVRARALGLPFHDGEIADLMQVNRLTILKHRKELVKFGYWKETPGAGPNGETVYSVIVDPR